jgi:Transposase DDE domain group 1
VPSRCTGSTASVGRWKNLIKLHNTPLASDRMSCHSATANQVRLALHTAAFWLMHGVRTAINALARGEFATIRERLIKIGARVIEHIARIRVQLPTSCPEATLFRTRCARPHAVRPISCGAMCPAEPPPRHQPQMRCTANGSTESAGRIASAHPLNRHTKTRQWYMIQARLAGFANRQVRQIWPARMAAIRYPPKGPLRPVEWRSDCRSVFSTPGREILAPFLGVGSPKFDTGNRVRRSRFGSPTRFAGT